MLEERNNIVISIIVAMSENNVIGRDNDMPWHIPGDLKRFKSLTYGHPVIMGRKTLEAIIAFLGMPLPGRPNIVISRGRPDIDNIILVHNLKAAIRKAKSIAARDGVNEIFIIGGGQIYAQTLLFADRIYLTRIHKYIKGDSYFPQIDLREWKTRDKEFFEGDPPYSFISLDRTV
ncbi:MAG: dihydrofolate reductase [Alphaproteobacteria bacterium]|nr:dihydrofolate reductase [Alphaproteobacteria bacterium]